MNLVILDGRISSMIERISDSRRTRARFTVTTAGDEEVGVEVRGSGADRLSSEWEPGDTVHVRGRVTATGYVAADLIRRVVPRTNRRAETRASIPPYIASARRGYLQTTFYIPPPSHVSYGPLVEVAA